MCKHIYHIDGQIINAYLDDEPQKEGKLDVYPRYSLLKIGTPQYLGADMFWNGISVGGVLIHWEWQSEQEYDLFMYSE